MTDAELLELGRNVAGKWQRPFTVDGRPATNVEMHALLAWHRYLRVEDEHMVKVGDVYQGGRWLKSEDLLNAKTGKYGEVKVIINTADVGTVGQGDDERQQIILTFDGKEKQLGLNKTNATVLAGHFGDDTDQWLGKEIILFVDPYVPFAGKVVPGIRIRVPGTTEEDEEIPF